MNSYFRIMSLVNRYLTSPRITTSDWQASPGGPPSCGKRVTFDGLMTITAVSYFGRLWLSVFIGSPRSTLSLPALFTPSLPGVIYIWIHLPAHTINSVRADAALHILALPASDLVVWGIMTRSSTGMAMIYPSRTSSNVDDASNTRTVVLMGSIFTLQVFYFRITVSVDLTSKDLFMNKEKSHLHHNMS